MRRGVFSRRLKPYAPSAAAARGPAVRRSRSFSGGSRSSSSTTVRDLSLAVAPGARPSRWPSPPGSSPPPPAPSPSPCPPSGDNQKSAVIQSIGLVEVRIDYSSPDVHAPDGTDRTGKIWGELVPWGMAEPRVRHRRGIAVARRRQREHRVHGVARRVGAGQEAAGRPLRPAHDPGRAGVDDHLLQELELVGQLLLRPEGGRAPRHHQGREGAVPRVAHLRVHRSSAGQRHGRARVGEPARPVHRLGAQPGRPLRRAHRRRPARADRVQLAGLDQRGPVLPAELPRERRVHGARRSDGRRPRSIGPSSARRTS